MIPSGMRRRHVTFVQYGDYAETMDRISKGLPENYAAQYYSIEVVERLAASLNISVISVTAPRARHRMPSGVEAIGLGWKTEWQPVDLIRHLESVGTTDLVLRTPITSALVWALGRGRRVLPLLADSFGASISFLARLRQRSLVQCLNSGSIDVVANHNRPASRDLVRMGVQIDKVVPWDWPAMRTPQHNSTKSGGSGDGSCRIVYAGAVSVDKGVGDLLEAVAILREQGVPASALIAGGGDVEAMKGHAARLGIQDSASFLGRIANDEVFRLMRKHDFVVVPSRHVYPEGLPMTIYEGLCSRSPLFISDHPMFVSALKGSAGVQFFRAQDPGDLARVVRQVMDDPSTYQALSANSAASWDAIQVPLKFKELLELWLDGQPQSLATIKSFALKVQQS